MKQYWVYILCSKERGTLYVGMTNDINRRVYEHKQKLISGFTKKYGVTRLVYVEGFSNINEAIYREKRLKAWKRDWKLQLIEQHNPKWMDLYDFL